MRMITNLFNTYFPKISVKEMLLVTCFAFVLFGAILLFQDKKKDNKNRIIGSCSISLTITYVVLLVVMLVINRNTSNDFRVILQPFHSYPKMLQNTNTGKEWRFLAVSNVMLFIPFGFFHAFKNHMGSKSIGYISLGYVKKQLISALKKGFLVSLFIEALQLFLKRGLFEVDDLIHNTVGAVVGAFLFVSLCKFLKFLSHKKKFIDA